jgi:ABC-type enterochelin transport system permease subunit
MAIPLSGITTDQHADVDESAIRAHATLTGLIGGCAGAAVTGTVLVTVGCHRYGAPSMAGAGFVAAVGTVLFLRVRTHVDEARRRALAAAGMASISAAVVISAMAYPTQMGWASAVLIAVGLGAARPLRLNAATVRTVEALEYAALAAVVPLACWVGGCYAMARGVSLP